MTELGRQPWIVFGLMKTAAGVSNTVGGLAVLFSLVLFTAVYGALMVVTICLLQPLRQERSGQRRAAGRVVLRLDEWRPNHGSEYLVVHFDHGAVYGFFFLEGFDYGVGILLPFWARMTLIDG